MLTKLMRIATAVPRSLQRSVITLAWRFGIGSQTPSSRLPKRSLQDHCTDQGAYGLEQRTESHPTGRQSKLIAAIVNVETTGPNPKRDKIVELGIARF